MRLSLERKRCSYRTYGGATSLVGVFVVSPRSVPVVERFNESDLPLNFYLAPSSRSEICSE
jgi:hypothetical protein